MFSPKRKALTELKKKYKDFTYRGAGNLLVYLGQAISTNYSEQNHNHMYVTFCDIIQNMEGSHKAGLLSPILLC